MFEPSSSVPPGGRAAAKDPPGAGGRLFAFLCWLVLIAAIAVLVVVSFIRSEHREAADRRYAIAGEQRSVAAAAAMLAKDVAGGVVPAVSRVSDLRGRSLGLLARVSPRPVADLPAEWGRLAAGLDTIEAEWARILAFRTGLEALRHEARILREDSDRLVESLSAGGAVPPEGAEALAITSRRFEEEVERARLTEPAGFGRARSLLEVHARVQRLLAAGTARPSSTGATSQTGRAPAGDAELEAVGSRLDAARARMQAVLGMVGELGAVSRELRNLVESGARVIDLLPEFEARGGPAPVLLGASLDTRLMQSAALALAALLGLFWRSRRLRRAEAAGLDQAWSEAAESDWRARALVRDLLRAIGAIDRQDAAGRMSTGPGELEEDVREAVASLPRIVARRSRLAAVLLSAHESLRERLAAARDSVLDHLGSGSGELDTGALLKIEATFREATLFAMAALVREIRAAASEPVPAGAPGPAGTGSDAAARADQGSETVRDTVARAFDLLDAGLERVLAGEGEGSAAFIFLLDDLRTVRGKAPFSSSLDFAPDLEAPMEGGSDDGAVIRADAARMLPSFRKGLAEWTAGEGDGDPAAKLMRGSVSVLARAAEDGMSPARSFWGAAAAFCTALCERAIPAGPAVRRILGEVAEEIGETAEREEAPPPPDRLLQDLLIYVALAESDHAELQEVRTAFRLERYPLAVPEHPVEAESADGGRPDDTDAVSGEIIQQLEGIRAVLERIDGPSETSPGPTPTR